MHGDPRGSRYLRSPNAFGRTQEAGALEPASPDTAGHGQGAHPDPAGPEIGLPWSFIHDGGDNGLRLGRPRFWGLFPVRV